MIVDQNFGWLKVAQDANYNVSGGVDQANNQLGELVNHSEGLNSLIKAVTGNIVTLQAQIRVNPNASINFLTTTIVPNLNQLQEAAGGVTAGLNQFKVTMDNLQNSIRQTQAVAQSTEPIQ